MEIPDHLHNQVDQPKKEIIKKGYQPENGQDSSTYTPPLGGTAAKPPENEKKDAQIISIKTETAIKRDYWVVILGLMPKRDGDEWCFLWGDSLQDGVCAFGKTPLEAIQNFDKAMYEKLPDFTKEFNE